MLAVPSTVRWRVLCRARPQRARPPLLQRHRRGAGSRQVYGPWGVFVAAAQWPAWQPSDAGPEPGTQALPFNTVPEAWAVLAEQHGELTAVIDTHHEPATQLTYSELRDAIFSLARGLQRLGLRRHERVALFAENSHRWLVCDQAVMNCGATDAVRGSANTPTAELSFILASSASVGVLCEDAATLKSIAPQLNALNVTRTLGSRVRFAVVLWGDVDAALVDEVGAGCEVLSYADVAEMGRADMEAKPNESFTPPDITDIATLVYTSGTSGESPREGVCLTHGNLMHQLGTLGVVIGQPQPGDTAVSMLPPWHIYERTTTYFRCVCAMRSVYSAPRHLKVDLLKYEPKYFCTVPLVLDTIASQASKRLATTGGVTGTVARSLFDAGSYFVLQRRTARGLNVDYARLPPPWGVKAWAVLMTLLMTPLYLLADKLVYSKIRAGAGLSNVVCVVTGGGSLGRRLDDWYEVLGMEVLNGWGLTETSPVVAARRLGNNVRGTVGVPLPATQVRVVEPATLVAVPHGSSGVLLARGPQVMRSDLGYEGNAKANAAAFPLGDEWFNTGDLGFICPQLPGSGMAGQVVLTGRAKDTIVLTSGENVEPEPIEQAVLQSPYIRQVMIVGQDQKALAAVVVPDMDYKAYHPPTLRGELLGEVQWASLLTTSPDDFAALMLEQVQTFNKRRAGYRRAEAVVSVLVTEEPFSSANGLLGNTLKLKRAAVLRRYTELLDDKVWSDKT